MAVSVQHESRSYAAALHDDVCMHLALDCSKSDVSSTWQDLSGQGHEPNREHEQRHFDVLCRGSPDRDIQGRLLRRRCTGLPKQADERVRSTSGVWSVSWIPDVSYAAGAVSMMQSCYCEMIVMITSMACRSCLPICSSPAVLSAALQFGGFIAISCRMLSPEGSHGQGLYGQRAFSSVEQLSKTWKALTAGCSLDASAAPANAPELDVGQITGVALLESLCVHLEPGAVARTGVASQLLPLLYCAN